MKTMLWMRHGKSDWDAGYGRDHDRPLATRGEKAAKAMGTALANAGFLPDFVLSSTAVRARTYIRARSPVPTGPAAGTGRSVAASSARRTSVYDSVEKSGNVACRAARFERTAR